MGSLPPKNCMQIRLLMSVHPLPSLSSWDAHYFCFAGGWIGTWVWVLLKRNFGRLSGDTLICLYSGGHTVCLMGVVVEN